MQIAEEKLEALVHGFYARVRQDATLGPIFNARIADWEPHLKTMVLFWSSVANGSGRYKGQPMMVHMRMDELDKPHFERWLALFRETAADVLNADEARHVIERANRIAESFQLGLGFYREQVAALA